MGTALLLASRMRPVIAAAEELSWAAVQPDRTAKSRAQTQRCRDRGYRAYRRKPRRAMRMQRRTFVPLVNGSRLRIRFLPGHSSESRIATARGLASAAAGDAQYRRMANWSARTSPRQPTPGHGSMHSIDSSRSPCRAETSHNQQGGWCGWSARIGQIWIPDILVLQNLRGASLKAFRSQTVPPDVYLPRSEVIGKTLA